MIGGPQKPIFCDFGGFGGPPTTPETFFFTNFQHLIIFSGLLGYQNRFPFYFIIMVHLIMIFLRIYRFFVQNLGILYSKILALKTPKVRREDLKKRSQNLPNHHWQYVRELLAHFWSKKQTFTYITTP